MRDNFGVQLINMNTEKVCNSIRYIYQQDHPIELKETFKFINTSLPHLIVFG